MITGQKFFEVFQRVGAIGGLSLAIAGDLDEILKTIESIRGIDSTTADSLASLAHEYDYQSILDRLSEVQS